MTCPQYMTYPVRTSIPILAAVLLSGLPSSSSAQTDTFFVGSEAACDGHCLDIRSGADHSIAGQRGIPLLGYSGCGGDR
jgi:hypothetical protein